MKGPDGEELPIVECGCPDKTHKAHKKKGGRAEKVERVRDLELEKEK